MRARWGSLEKWRSESLLGLTVEMQYLSPHVLAYLVDRLGGLTGLPTRAFYEGGPLRLGVLWKEEEWGLEHPA